MRFIVYLRLAPLALAMCSVLHQTAHADRTVDPDMARADKLESSARGWKLVGKVVMIASGVVIAGGAAVAINSQYSDNSAAYEGEIAGKSLAILGVPFLITGLVMYGHGRNLVEEADALRRRPRRVTWLAPRFTRDEVTVGVGLTW